MRVIVTASRTWDRADVVWTCLDIVAAEAAAIGEKELVVVHGCAEGGDTAADLWVRKGGHPLPVTAERHPPNYRRFGNRATWIRNTAMVRRGGDVCLAFVRDRSSGATKTGQMAERYEIPVQWLDYADLPPVANCPECRCDPARCESDESGQHCADSRCPTCLDGCPLDDCAVCGSLPERAT